MAEQTLTKKLNEWAGTTDVDYTHPTYGIAYCFQWLVPKLTWYQINNWGRDNHHAFVCLKRKETGGSAETPALALCLAIEKLIDGSKET